MDNEKSKENPSPESNCRWSSYSNYKLILWAWMMNDITVMFSPVETTLVGFYLHGLIQVLSSIFVGIPIIYSEICIAQYTNCNIITMWNFLPLFRNVGFGTFYLILLKTVYFMVLTSWYLKYSFFASLDPPPWYSCAEFNDSKCMVKMINISVFQNCLEAESQFNDDCGMKTASNCFFEREIGEINTKNSLFCLLPWKMALTSSTVVLLLFLLSLKKEKFIQMFVKLMALYVCLVVLTLFCVALSTSGTWFASNVALNWRDTFHDSMHSLNRGILSLGSGCGIVIFLSRDTPFRSPAIMTAVSISLFSIVLSLTLTLIAFSGIKTMIYFHGEEQNVIELGSSVFFMIFACMTEIMNYFDAVHLWSFIWFSAIFLCLFSNLGILIMFLGDLLHQIEVARKYKNLSSIILLIVLNVMAWPFFCSDLTAVLTDATEIMQITNNFIFSFSLYWVYGFNNHNVDITFMIGVKASYFWKLCWLANPIILVVILYGRWEALEVNEYGSNSSYNIETLNLRCDVLLLYIVLSIYCAIILFGILLQVYVFYRQDEIREIFSPTSDWGPLDKTLSMSRKMFVPEIMTTEFLYRQVRVRGYGQRKCTKKTVKRTYEESSIGDEEWSTFTSN